MGWHGDWTWGGYELRLTFSRTGSFHRRAGRLRPAATSCGLEAAREDHASTEQSQRGPYCTAVVWPASALGRMVSVGSPRSTPMIFVDQSSESGRPSCGVTLLARSRLAERMQAFRDEGQRLSLDVVGTQCATRVSSKAAR